MTRAADDFDAIRKAMIDRGLDGDNGASLREQQKRAGSIDRELKPQISVGVVDEGLSVESWNIWAYWGFKNAKIGSYKNPDVDRSRHHNEPQKKAEAWDAWNAGALAAQQGDAEPPKQYEVTL
jgi:hypothetical protein